MPIPDFQSLMLPLLRLVADGEEYSMVDVRERLADDFDLSQEDRDQLLPSGRQAVFANRVAWAKSYLQQGGLLSSIRRGRFRIAPRGIEVLTNSPDRIDIKFLQQFPEFVEFRYVRKKSSSEQEDDQVETKNLETPEETLEESYLKVKDDLISEILTKVKSASPYFFEKLVVELLLAMGYGGSRSEAGKAIGKSGDEGIDGTISEDRLGLDMIYLQAKKWEGSIGRPEIQRFVGALHGKRARKGVFLTTSTFTSEAVKYVENIDPKVVLIDGRQLAELMIDYTVGVTPVATYQIKRIDTDYFSEE